MSGLVARADRLHRLALAILLGLVGCLLPSCSASTSPGAPRDPVGQPGSTAGGTAGAQPGQARPAPAQDTAAQHTLDIVARAIRSRNRAAFQHELASLDPAASAPAANLYRLAALPLVSLSLRLRPLHDDLPRSRRQLLGPDAFVQQVALDWELRDDGGPAEHLIWLTFVPGDGAVRLGGTGDGPATATAQPLWLLEPLTASTSTRTLVLAGPGRQSGGWLQAGDAAVGALRTRLHGGLGARWDGRLVFELPSTRAVFEQVLGVVPGSYAQIAAVAWPEGPDPATAAVRILVNPELATRLDKETLGVLVTHEATHVATRSAASPAPTWLVEGFADYQAYEAHPRTAARAAAPLLAQVKAGGPPRSLPSNASFSPGATDLENTYAQSWLACRYLARAYSDEALDRFYRAVDSGADVEDALQTVFGLTERTFTSRWAAGLESASRQRSWPG